MLPVDESAAKVLRAPSWAAIDTARKSLEEAISDARSQQALELGERAIAFPEFADDCPLTTFQDCNDVNWAAVHARLEIRTLLDAEAGRWDAAWKRSEALWRSDLALLRSARRALSMAVAQNGALESLRVISLLGERTPLRERSRAALGELDAQLASLRADDLSVDRAQCGEYLQWLAMVNVLDKGLRHYPSPLYSRDQALRLGTQYFADLQAHLHDPSGHPAPSAHFAPRRHRWLTLNPAGKLMLDTTIADLSPVLTYVVRQQRDVLSARAAARASVARLLRESL